MSQKTILKFVVPEEKLKEIKQIFSLLLKTWDISDLSKNYEVINSNSKPFGAKIKFSTLE